MCFTQFIIFGESKWKAFTCTKLNAHNSWRKREIQPSKKSQDNKMREKYWQLLSSFKIYGITVNKMQDTVVKRNIYLENDITNIFTKLILNIYSYSNIE